MCWRVLLSTVFLFILLACVIYLVFSTMPPAHKKLYDRREVAGPYLSMNNWRTMDYDHEKSMPSSSSLLVDASGNILYRPWF